MQYATVIFFIYLYRFVNKYVFTFVYNNSKEKFLSKNGTCVT